MVVHRSKKARGQRAGRTHGWGSPKKHRGAGSRGGRGRAGTGKKGQQAMSRVHSRREALRKKGFVRPAKAVRKEASINLRDIELRLDGWLAGKTAVKRTGAVDVDLGKTRYTKVLAGGSPRRKMVVKAARFSAAAEEKLKRKGGKAVRLEK